MKNKRHVIVTGGAGFMGSHIASRLIEEGYKVTVLDNLSTGKRKNIPRKADFIEIDLGKNASYEHLKNITCEAVFHLAGQSSGEISFRDPLYDLESHVLSTFWLLEWCKNKGVSRFLYSSSMGVYGEPDYLPVDEKHPLHPKSFYGAAKISAEAYIRLYQTLGINTTILRFFNVYGPGQNLDNKLQGMLSIFLSYMLEKRPITVRGSKDRFRDFIYITDAVDACLECFHNPKTYGKVYNVATGTKTKVEELLTALKDSFGDQNYLTRYKDGTPGDQFKMVASIARIKKDLGWNPKVDFGTGVAKTVEFEKNRIKKAQFV